MKIVKNLLLLIGFLSALITSLTFGSCKEGADGDPCSEIECMNGGEKYKVSDDECYCQCPVGYEGDHCEIMLANCSGVECPVGKAPNPAKDCLCE